MKITLLGTCSGTEPMPSRRHCSFVVEHKKNVYFFDAGESCSYTAHTTGIDLLTTRAIFVSHPHIDHTGGLGNLIWTLRKLNTQAPNATRRLSGKTVRVFMPDMDLWDWVMKFLNMTTDGGFYTEFSLDVNSCQDGRLYEENGLNVTALHNHHIPRGSDSQPWKSFSFRIEAENKSLVFSGDVESVKDVDSLIDNCDVFLMETGHHKVEDICRYLKDSKKDFGRLGFTHHGRAILADPDRELNKAKDILGDKVFIANDGLVLNL